MATTKITDLTAYTDPVNTDVLPIVDVTSDVTKKVSVANVMKNASLGTAAAPGISFDGDPNTGIYSPGADQVAVTTGGTQRLLIDSAGAVTIAGDLTVNGTTTNINTQNLVVEDKNIVLGDVTTPTDVTADGGGITLKGTTDKTINWVDSTDAWTSSERFSYPTGSAAAPTLTFTGDTNTGIYSPGADQVAISTNGQGRLFVNSSGSIGLGTNNPNTTAHVAGSLTVNDRLFLQRSSSSLYLAVASYWDGTTNPLSGTKGDIVALGNTGGDGVAFVNGNTERMRLTSTGLGIGTSSPGVELDVNGTIRSRSTFRLYSSSNDIFYIAPGTVITGGTANDIALRSDATGSILFSTNGATERMRIDSSGRVGIGTSPSDKLHIDGGSIRITGSNPQYIQAVGINLNFNTDSQNIIFLRSGTEMARFDSSSRLLVGTSSTSAQTRALFQGNSAGTSTAEVFLAADTNAPSGGLGNIYFSDNGHTKAAIIAAVRDGGTWTSGSSQPTSLQFYTTANGASSPTEWMRISQNGTVSIGTTTSSGAPAEAGITFDQDGASRARIGSNGNYISEYYNASGTLVGYVQVNSGSVTYSTTSDYRLKENLEPLTGALERLEQLAVYRFNFTADPDNRVDGFVAHEVQAVVPEAISGQKDAINEDGSIKPQGIDQSKLVPLLTAALQEAVARIEQLETAVATLQGS